MTPTSSPLATAPPPEFKPADRLAAVGVSEILRITAAAEALRRSGRSVVTLGAGEPDFDTPENVKEAARRAMAEGATKYTALDGTRELKEAVREKFRRENGLDYRLDEISCGAGVKQVLFNALAASLDPGDEVIVPAPYWTSYAGMVAICGGRTVAVPCREDRGFRLGPEDLERAITPRTRWLLLNSPSNPCGATYEGADLEALAEVLRRHPRVWVLSDDIYEHLVYDGHAFATMAAVAPDLGPRTLTLNGVSKTYAMTGWRIGYGAGPRPLIEAMATVQSQATSCPSSIGQAAAAEALTGPQDVVAERRVAFRSRRDRVVDALGRIPGLSCRRPRGAFYAFVGCGGLMGLRPPGGERIWSDAAFCRYLLESGVAVVPGSCFGLAPHFRVSFAEATDTLDEGVRRIERACRRLEN